ncbi:MAG TPA: hypothetical protein VK446_16460 [Methylocystis sp.]|nr:hypothetical protein [Methylocystis sp.]
MWRQRLDIFWDGQRTLALDVFDAEGGGAPELAVFAARDADFGQAWLLDAISPARWRRGGAIVELPVGCALASLRAPDGSELLISLVKDPPDEAGEQRLLLIERARAVNERPHAAFRIAQHAARADLERLTREEIAAVGAKLVWAISQRRQTTAPDRVGLVGDSRLLIRLWPAQIAYPTQQSRLVVEALELRTQMRLAPLKAPFAIMEHWLSEAGAPMATLRLRLPSPDQIDAALAGVSVVLVMHQRRRLRALNLEQSKAGGGGVDPLSLADIRQATGWPQERPDAALTAAPIVVHSLRELISGGQRFDGVSARRRNGNGCNGGDFLELDFFGAALGDDIGLVSPSADSGELTVRPSDPGGARSVRLFRIARDGLVARKVEDDDPLLDEIMRIVAGTWNAAASAADRSSESALSAQGRRELLLAEFNADLAAVNYSGRLRASKNWEVLEPIMLAAFVMLVEDATPAGRAYLHGIGGYEAFRADPSLVSALTRLEEFAPGLDETALRERRLAVPSIAYRFIAACGLARLLAPGANAQSQSAAWRLFSHVGADSAPGLPTPPFARRLTEARIFLDGSPDLERAARRAAQTLASEAMVERAAIYCEAAQRPHEGEALRAYLVRRREGAWTALAEASVLAKIVDEADGYWREVERGGRPELETRPPEPAGVLARVRSFFIRGGD